MEQIEFDLVDEMQWEDVAAERGLMLTLEEAGLEESNDDEPLHGIHHSNDGSIYGYTDWFYEEEHMLH